MSYEAPVSDIAFTLSEVAGMKQLASMPAFEAYDEDLLEPILEEAGKLARDVLAPLNQVGDQQGAKLG